MIEWNSPADDLLHENAAGCLAGIAIGDALGNRVESLSHAELRQLSGRVTLAGKSGAAVFEPGKTTDDTAQTISLAESIIACHGFIPSDFAARLTDWYRQRPNGVGRHTSRVLASIAAGEDWEKAALEIQMANPASAGNGSLMRCAPIALFDSSSPQALIEDSRVSSRVTHPHSYCQWSCVFTNLVIAELLDGIIPARAVDKAAAVCARRGDVNQDVLERARLSSMHGNLENLRPTGFVLDTLACALWCLLHTDDFETAVTCAVSLGGDADTIGAVTGALAGAAYGLESIPARWLDLVDESGALKELAISLVELS